MIVDYLIRTLRRALGFRPEQCDYLNAHEASASPPTSL